MKPVYNKSIPLPTTPKEYIKFERAANFQIDELVNVFRSARSNEGGWHNSWTELMDAFVGRTHRICDVGLDNGSGIGLNPLGNSANYFKFPYFVLERVLREENPNV